MNSTVAVLDDYQNVARQFGPWDRLSDQIDLTTFSRKIEGHDELAKALKPFDIIVAMRERTPFPRELLEKLPNLRLLVTTGPFNTAIDIEAAQDHEVVVSATGFSLAGVVELTWGLLVCVSRQICAEDRGIRDGGWQHTVGPELQGRTLGLLGLGNVGKLIAGVAHAFDMNVVAWSQNLRKENAAAHRVTAVAKDELFRTSDFVSVHYKLSERSHHLVGATEFALMKPTSYLVNTSRGSLIDEAALVAALSEGQIAGAGLDVFEEEPLPQGHLLRSLPNTVLTPHIGYVAARQYEEWYHDIVEDIEGFLRGDPVRVITG